MIKAHGDDGMVFSPYVIWEQDLEKVAVEIRSATQDDIAKIKADSVWQSDWESTYLSSPNVTKFAMKLRNGNLLALGAYQISVWKAHVYILYVESAPPSNPTMIAFTRRE